MVAGQASGWPVRQHSRYARWIAALGLCCLAWSVQALQFSGDANTGFNEVDARSTSLAGTTLNPPSAELDPLPTALPAASAEATPGQEQGAASWYARHFQGRRTANGERYDQNQLTAAHKTLPFGTVVRVRSEVNGQEVDVRINDRGPFVAGRVIDLSQAAARALGMLQLGVKKVSLLLLPTAAPVNKNGTYPTATATSAAELPSTTPPTRAFLPSIR